MNMCSKYREVLSVITSTVSVLETGLPGIAVPPGVTHSDSRIVFVTGAVVKHQLTKSIVSRISIDEIVQ